MSFPWTVSSQIRFSRRPPFVPRTQAMSLVTASTWIAVAPAEVWKMVMDPHRLSDWVTIHRRLLRADDGPPRVGISDGPADPPARREPRGSLDAHRLSRQTSWRCGRVAAPRGRALAREYILHAEGDGTRFDYRNEFHPPLGPVGAIVSRALVGGMPEREAKRTLDRLRAHLESRVPRQTLGRTSVR